MPGFIAQAFFKFPSFNRQYYFSGFFLSPAQFLIFGAFLRSHAFYLINEV